MSTPACLVPVLAAHRSRRPVAPTVVSPDWSSGRVVAAPVIGSIVTSAVLCGGATAGFPTGLHLFAADLRVEVWGASLKVVTADRTDERRYTESPMQALDADFIEAVRRRDPSRVRTPYADAARTLAITLAGEESARTGRVIEVARI